MSFREIGFILKKHGLSHGIAMTEDDDKNKNKCSSEKATQAYRLDEGKKPIELAIDTLRMIIQMYYEKWWQRNKIEETFDTPHIGNNVSVRICRSVENGHSVIGSPINHIKCKSRFAKRSLVN